jgi:thiamine biosynthesis lipoprotein
MGSDAHLVVHASAGWNATAALLTLGWTRVDELERRWSRFLPTSEISLLNQRAGAPVAVSDETVLLVTLAMAAWEMTAGRFDPTVGAALSAYGYDRDFALVAQAPTVSAAPPDPRPAPGPAGITVEAEAHTVTLPAGVTFDPGGIGKGLAADLVVEALVDAGAAGALVNLGGDLRVAGEPPDGDGWSISLPDPVRPERELARFSLPDGGVATSSRLHRWWPTTTGPAHHLLDPSTGRPSTTATVAATVVADRAWRAEALAKAVFLGGEDDLDRHAAHAIVVTADGHCHATPALAEALR